MTSPEPSGATPGGAPSPVAADGRRVLPLQPAAGAAHAPPPKVADPGPADPGAADPGAADPGAADPGAADPGAAVSGADESGPTTFFEAVGGQATFERLGHEFYARVADDPVLRPLYPDEDLQEAEQHLVLFLSQYWGGPTTYSDRRGHPRLRMRHRPFVIGPAERDAWLANMRRSLDVLALEDRHDAVLWEYLVRAAFSLQNAG